MTTPAPPSDLADAVDAFLAFLDEHRGVIVYERATRPSDVQHGDRLLRTLRELRGRRKTTSDPSPR